MCRKSQSQRKRNQEELQKQEAAQSSKARRNLIGEEFKQLADLLPVGYRVTKQSDVLRLTVHYFRTKKYSKCDKCSTSSDYQSANSQVDVGNLMLECLDGFLILVCKNAHIYYVSKHVENILGIPMHQMIGKKIYDFVHHEDHPLLATQFCDWKPPGTKGLSLKSVNPEDCLGEDAMERETLDLSTFVRERCFYVRMKCKYIPRGQRQQIKAFMYVQWSGRLMLRHADDKISKRAILGLSAVCRPTQSMAEIQCGAGFFVSHHDEGLKFVHCNDHIAELIGFKSLEIKGKSLYQYINPCDAPKIQQFHILLLKNNHATSRYYRFIKKDGQSVWMRSEAYIVYHEDNETIKEVQLQNTLVTNQEGERALEIEADEEVDEHMQMTFDDQKISANTSESDSSTDISDSRNDDLIDDLTCSDDEKEINLECIDIRDFLDDVDVDDILKSVENENISDPEIVTDIADHTKEKYEGCMKDLGVDAFTDGISSLSDPFEDVQSTSSALCDASSAMGAQCAIVPESPLSLEEIGSNKSYFDNILSPVSSCTIPNYDIDFQTNLEQTSLIVTDGLKMYNNIDALDDEVEMDSMGPLLLDNNPMMSTIVTMPNIETSIAKQNAPYLLSEQMLNPLEDTRNTYSHASQVKTNHVDVDGHREPHSNKSLPNSSLGSQKHKNIQNLKWTLNQSLMFMQRKAVCKDHPYQIQHSPELKRLLTTGDSRLGEQNMTKLLFNDHTQKANYIINKSQQRQKSTPDTTERAQGLNKRRIQSTPEESSMFQKSAPGLTFQNNLTPNFNDPNAVKLCWN